jgi:hypothetical protein
MSQMGILKILELLRLWGFLQMDEKIFTLYYENLGVRMRCYVLNMKCPFRLTCWMLSGYIFGGRGNITEFYLAGQSLSLWRFYVVLSLLLTLCFLSTWRWVASGTCSVTCVSHVCQISRATMSWNLSMCEPSDSLFPSVVLLRYFVTLMQTHSHDKSSRVLIHMG